MRVALYARYSSDLQNERSAADQLAALRRHLAARGWSEVAAFADEAVSGASLHNRPGIMRLLSAAASRDFDLVLAEDLDRIARDQESAAHVRKRLAFADVALETLTQGRLEGQAGVLQAAFAGAMGELFLDNLRHKTRRGLEARVRAGASAGGRCYGYSIPAKGELAIVESEADVIRQVFDAYAAGDTPRAIAIRLNAAGVAGPRGGTWSPTTISGDRRAGDGILCQELYIGVRVFNRRSYRKHPDTGARAGRLNPPETWIREAVPHLRIVSDDQWAAVGARLNRFDLEPTPRASTRKPRRLLSGLIRCSLCQGPMTLNGPRYECARRRERGVCANRKVISAQAIEVRVIDGVRGHLLEPDRLAQAARAWHDDQAAERAAAIAARLPLERQLAAVERRIGRATEMYLAEQIQMPELKATLEPLKAQKAAIAGQLALAADPASDVVQLNPRAVDLYRALAEQLQEALAAPDGDDARTAFRALIERIDFTPLPGHGQYALTVHGQLAQLLQISNAKNPTASDCGVSRERLGAGARSGQDPTTLRISFAA